MKIIFISTWVRVTERTKGGSVIITEIIPFDKRKSKVLLDGGAILVLYKGELKRYHITEKEDLSEEIYREIVDDVLCKRARERIVYLLSSSDKTEAQLRKKLQDGYYPQEAIECAISFGKKCHYIDDENYGRRYLEFNGERKSSKQICYDLGQKGLSKDMIQILLEEHPVEEEGQIENFLAKKGYQKEKTTLQDRQKLINSLLRKGFSYRTVEKILNKDLAG